MDVTLCFEARVSYEKPVIDVQEDLNALQPEVCCYGGCAFGEYPGGCGKPKWESFECIGLNT